MGGGTVRRSGASICYTPRMRFLAAAFVATHGRRSIFARRKLTAPQSRIGIGISRRRSIFFNGAIYTGEGFREGKPRDGGSHGHRRRQGAVPWAANEEMKRLAGPKTQLRDLNTARSGVFLFPGFNDAHVHLGEAGQDKAQCGSAGRRVAFGNAGAG